MRSGGVVTLVALALCAGAAFSGAVPTAVGPADGATVTVHTAKQSAYLSKSQAERETIGKDRTLHSALTKADDPRWSGVDHAGTFPQPVTLSWTGEGPFTVEVRRASDSKVFFAATGLAANSVDVFNFEIDCTYSWTVGNASGISPASTFTTDSVFPRLLWDRDGEGKIYGVRDLGGCFVSNGAYRVRQGLVFRSSKLNDNATGTTPGASFVSDANRSTWLNDFGVRYELDLRGGSGEAGNLTASPLGGTVTYKHISGVDYGIADSAANKTAIKSELVYALDPAHYPLVFHCSIGHDRTGTLALLMHGLLGVSEDDILRNYEASWFWYCKGTDSGVAGHYSGIDRIRTALAAYSGATMADRVVAYCKDIGITDTQIAAFRGAMLEPVGGTPAIVAPEIGATVEVQTDLQKGFLTLDAATRKSDAWFGSEARRTELMGMRPLNTHPRKVTLAWAGEGAPWTVSLRKDGSDDAPVAVWSNVTDDHVTVDNLEVGCGYRWTVSGSAGSATGTFATEDVTPRFLRAGSRTAAEGGPDVSNVRDMGGYVGLDGRRVRQGRLFRTGQLDRDGVSILSDETRTFFCDVLKVKTDIDLRGTLSASPLGAGVALVDAEVSSYAHFSNKEGSRSMTATGFKALFKALAQESSYPAFFHCAAGQDRTGCIAYILGALLGVDESELVKDWEASVFHNAKGGFGFALSADYQAGDYYDLDVFVRGLRTFGKATMRENAEAWAKYCGCTDADIAAFRSLMLEPSGFGDADTAAVTYTWSATGEGLWMRPANWTPSVTPCYGVPDAPKATVTFPATVAEGTVVTLADRAVNVKTMNFANTAAMTLRLDNGRITVAEGKSTDKNTVEIGKTGPATVEFSGANPQIKTLSDFSNGRLIFGSDPVTENVTTLKFTLPAVPWTTATAPLLSAGEDSPIRFYANVRFAVDATGVALAAGKSATYVLAYNGDGMRFGDKGTTLGASTVVCPEGVTGELCVVDKSLCVVLTAEGAPEEPIVDYYETTPFAREKTIICYGDSLTHGYGGNEIVIPATPNYFDGRMDGIADLENYPYWLAKLLPSDYNVIEQAKDGKATDAIMSWASGRPQLISTCDVTLPAEANAAVKLASNFLYDGTDGGYQWEKAETETKKSWYYGMLTPSLPCLEPVTDATRDSLTGWFGGVHVRVGGNHADERTVCRTDAGEGPVTIPAGTRFVPDSTVTYKDAVKVVFAGANDGMDRVQQVLALVRDGLADSSRYIVITPHTEFVTAGGSRTQTTATATERLFAETFGEHYLNLRLELVKRGVATAVQLGVMTAAEAAATTWNTQGAGLLCASDTTHFNSKGYAVLAQFVKEKLFALGYANDPDAPTGTATVTLDATASGGRVLPNVVSSLTIWGGFDRADYPEFLDWAILFTATGGNAERDLFVDPADESTTDDYDFTRLLRNCRNVLACGMKPYLHLGNVPVKFTKGCDPRRARLGGADGGSYGFNIRPPDDYAAYGAYMKAVANALVAEFGRDEVRSWRFSVLTEANNRHWFEAKDGTAASTKAAFFRLYDHTVKAFTDVLGDDIAIGTHLLGLDATSDMSTFAYTDFIAHCKSGANDATGGTGAPLNLFAFSYYFDHPDDDKANPKAGRMTDFATLRTALDKAGFSRAIVCMDEGRVYSTKNGGTNEDELVSRAVGQSWQAAFDVRAAKSAFDAGGDNFASWGHLSGPDSKIEGLPTASWFTARELAKFAGMRQLSPSVSAALASTKEQVDAFAAVDAKGATVRLAVCRFRDKLTFTDRARATLALTLPAAMRGKTAELSVLTLDDTNNWFTDWLADRKTYNIGATCFGSSQDDQAPLATLADPDARTLFAETLQPKYAARAASVVPRVTALEVPANGAVSLPIDLVGNAAVFVTLAVEPPEPSADRQFPEKLVFTGATNKDGLYFVTDYVPNLATTRIEMKFRLNDVTGQSSGLFVANGWTAGKAEAGNGTRVEYYYNKNGRTPWLSYNCGGATTDVSGFNDTTDFHVLVAEGRTFLLDGVPSTMVTDDEPSGLADGPLAIAAMMLGSGSFYNFPKMELAYFKVSERRGDGTYRLVHDYRPGTDASGAATLYDLVEQDYLVPTVAGTAKKLSVGGGTVDVDVVAPVVGGARAGESVVPDGFAAEDLRVVSGGQALTCGSHTYSKPHYVFAEARDGEIVVEIDPDEATIAGLGFDAAGNAVIKTGKVFEDFRYRVEHAESLPFGDFDATAYQVLGSDQALTVPRIGSRRFYRVRVIDQW